MLDGVGISSWDGYSGKLGAVLFTTHIGSILYFQSSMPCLCMSVDHQFGGISSIGPSHASLSCLYFQRSTKEGPHHPDITTPQDCGKAHSHPRDGGRGVGRRGGWYCKLMGLAPASPLGPVSSNMTKYVK